MHHSESESFPWGKAILCGLAMALFLVLLFGRSSCFSPPSASEQAESSSENTGNDSTAAEDTADQNPEEASGSEKESEGSENSGDSPANEEHSPAGNVADSESENEPASPAGTSQAPGSPDGSGPKTATSAESGSGYQVGGLNVRGERLGVILDVSGSMQRYLPALRSEIGASFPSAKFLEVEGCLLEPSSPDGFPTDGNRTSRRISVMNAMRELVEANRVDSIYWFCDLQDERTDQALTELRELLIDPNSSSPTRLYVRSTDDPPGETLADIITASGGAFEKRR